MKDILEELGVDFSSHELPFGLAYAVDNYVKKKEYFHEALHSVRSAFQLKSEAVPVKTFINHSITNKHIDGTVTDQFAFWQEIKDFIKQHGNDNWSFSHFVKGEVDLNTDPYEDYADLKETITVYAWIKSDNQPTTEEQDYAVRMVKMTERDLIFSKENLEMEIKNAK